MTVMRLAESVRTGRWTKRTNLCRRGADLAARWAGVEIDLAKITLPNQLTNDWLIVEGAGACWCRLIRSNYLDMAVKLKLQYFGGAQLAGTINHTLLTLAALHAAELPVHG